MGVSMLVDAIANRVPRGRDRVDRARPLLRAGLAAARVRREHARRGLDRHARLRPRPRASTSTATPIAGAELDVWQNDADMLYAVQKEDGPEDHLRGRYRTREDGSFAFVAVRPVPYPIPNDGPVGRMLDATGRHPWRPAHIHAIVRAPGHRTAVTHFFDEHERVPGLRHGLRRQAVAAAPLRRARRRRPRAPAPASTARGSRCESDLVLAPATTPASRSIAAAPPEQSHITNRMFGDARWPDRLTRLASRVGRGPAGGGDHGRSGRTRRPARDQGRTAPALRRRARDDQRGGQAAGGAGPDRSPSRPRRRDLRHERLGGDGAQPLDASLQRRRQRLLGVPRRPRRARAADLPRSRAQPRARRHRRAGRGSSSRCRRSSTTRTRTCA